MNPEYPIEVSIVIPCLNEADTLGSCLKKINKIFSEYQLKGEIIVADNGSNDSSIVIAEKSGAKVVKALERGYGNALMSGIDASSGQYIIIGDSDDSYDFLELPKFIEKLRSGFDLVQGCRLASGGGTIKPGAMPISHEWWGNPMFSLMAKWWFNSQIHDIYCGMRGFTKTHYLRMNLRCTGMEFAVEMIIKSSLLGANICEVPITLHQDGRKTHRSHLRTVRDGWRTLRYFLMCSPQWLYRIPGYCCFFLGLLGYVIALPGLTIQGITFEGHTLLFASLFILLGYQSILFGEFTQSFALSEGFLPNWKEREIETDNHKLEKRLLGGASLLILGTVLLLIAILIWHESNFGRLDYRNTMRLVIPGAMLTALGYQIILSSFFLSILTLHRR